ncbi:MAG TPA: hypothetical protein VG273_11735 [Bryobacteraceae bacterium]|jgi:hypothetical protein|nr:hypothetical protein [Bryobacteraceae bacterium]
MTFDQKLEDAVYALLTECARCAEPEQGGMSSVQLNVVVSRKRAQLTITCGPAAVGAPSMSYSKAFALIPATNGADVAVDDFWATLAKSAVSAPQAAPAPAAPAVV